MRTIHISDICEGDKIIIEWSGKLLTLEVSAVDFNDYCVRCKDNIIDFYPDDNGMFLQPD